jgi:hypothetical protein
MQQAIPSAADVRARLETLTAAALEALAQRSGVPITTLIKVRNGQTTNPRLETVRQFWPELIGADGAPDVPAEQEARNAA